ncbi:MAG: branched-chain amino acid ABC transporter substrate-binding protein [Anaerolineae bacterium]|nr:branched-chain amino acid ABC transporter substrate-binding protein [Anaerolineae bacterium]
MNKLSVWIVLILVVVVGLAACTPSAAPTKGEVIVYVAGPLSGFQANTGQTVAGGVRLMAEQLNRSGGLLGYKVKVIALDDEADSDVAAAVAEQIRDALARGERVIGVIGHPNSGQTAAAMAVYKDLPIVVITPTASEVGLTRQGYRNFFRINAANDLQAQAGAAYLVNQLGAKKVAVLYNDDPYGIDLGRLVADELTRLGATVPLSIQVAVEQNRFQAEVARIKESGADAIYYAGYEVECPYLRADLRDAGLAGLTFMASDGCFLAATIDNADGAAEGMYITGFAPSPKTAVDQAWVQAYQAVEYRNPDTYSINGYSAMQVLAEGVKRAGTLSAAQVADAIRKLDITTPLGKVQFQENGDLRSAKIYIFQVKDGQFVQVAP